ncbi:MULTISPECIES: N-acetylmuramic acid 6-phosphate etherase [Enterococcus]|uniref:N-acetylmuramic acid 6-phosphate etherase n=1 Tax=Enterococcus faecium TaxID=1352 RepID=A0A7V7GLX9_ENTFC|nr:MULTISPECIES: N-acetylmuramic acid 6-phosphate etherase [Enterococcus]EME7218690.1 N-acetylmuramic acid 6-phosphate etherase [Enterococcus faecium]EME8123667.1 N-acetylmuramic acid 6-phosphate etherase [Enterococcus faecium]EOH54455.1 N-acetylmuramic acid 6-phosphate etherase [Enterococcus faecium EnGen0263]KAA0689998.1 N-acetylmuramic acid 6-phosphate etherase [Enterococcus faecium]MBK5027305.1 N-acetylmuramic acid 6-phosphate etherase [Enterococcus faecium]
MEMTKLSTEQRNENSLHIDQMSASEMVKVMNGEDKKVALAVENALSNIAEAIEQAAARFNNGGRLIYIGAGTSGRLGALDAIELTPTYGVPPERAFGILAGGTEAMYTAIEGAEDSEELAVSDLEKVKLDKADILIAIAASGRTPYALSALTYGNKVGALTISITCTAHNVMSQEAQVAIEAVVGPEVVTGSTRMKAGTAQKMILNMLSTGVMIKSGKVYQNLMVNVQATNHKLMERSISILTQALEIDKSAATALFEDAGKKVNVAIVMYEQKLDRESAETYLRENNDHIIRK